MIEVIDLSTGYGEREVLQDISFEVSDGEILGVVGPNGAGKTTLLKCVDWLIRPWRGSVRIDGKDVKGASRARQIGYVPQITDDVPAVLVFDAVLMGRRPYFSWRPSEKDVESAWNIVELLGLEELAMRRLSDLSGGERQKVIIARALAQEPSVMLLDEPTSNLDIKHQIEIMELLRSYGKKGTSVMVAMHDLNMAVRYCDKLLMLKDGRIYGYGGREIISEKTIREVYGIGARIREDEDGMWIIPEML